MLEGGVHVHVCLPQVKAGHPFHMEFTKLQEVNMHKQMQINKKKQKQTKGHSVVSGELSDLVPLH